MSGFLKNGVNLDDILEPRGTSTARANVGFLSGSQNLSQRYYNRALGGSNAAATGFVQGSSDLGTLFAAKGSVNYGPESPTAGTTHTFRKYGDWSQNITTTTEAGADYWYGDIAIPGVVITNDAAAGTVRVEAGLQIEVVVSGGSEGDDGTHLGNIIYNGAGQANINFAQTNTNNFTGHTHYTTTSYAIAAGGNINISCRATQHETYFTNGTYRFRWILRARTTETHPWS